MSITFMRKKVKPITDTDDSNTSTDADSSVPIGYKPVPLTQELILRRNIEEQMKKYGTQKRSTRVIRNYNEEFVKPYNSKIVRQVTKDELVDVIKNTDGEINVEF